MTTIRNFCCNDFLDVTSMVMNTVRFDKSGIGSSPLSAYLQHLAELPNYFLVAVTPGNRIQAYGMAFIKGKNRQKHCELGEMTFKTTEMIERFIKIIEEKADKIDKVYYLEIWIPTAKKETINFLKQLGFASCTKDPDGETGCVTSLTVLEKDLSQNRGHS